MKIQGLLDKFLSIKNSKNRLTSSSLCILFTDTHASIIPLSTQGNALSGLISIFSRAIPVKTVAAVSLFPNKT